MKILGIDLGTTNSCVAVMEGKEPKVIENLEGGRTTPSIIAFKNNEIIVGDAAKRQAVVNRDTISSIKRKMGTNEIIKFGDKEYTPEQISAEILRFLKTNAEEKLGEKISKVVITVPAYFNDAQRQATKNAGRIAGLEVERIINEPTAAALAYGLDKLNKTQTILVFDLGGGTFDVSILELSDGTFQVLSTSGDNFLGGDDFDDIVMKWLVNTFKKDTGVDLSKDPIALQRLKDGAEKAKKDLSGAMQTNISLPFVSMKDEGPLHLEYSLTRTQFEEMVKPLLNKTIQPVKQALSDAKLTKDQIDQVLLVGGSTRMPMVTELVVELLNKQPNKTINPDEVVALGAAIQAGVISGQVKDILLLDVTPLSLGIETLGGVMTTLIQRNTTIPTSKSQIFSTAEDNQSSVDIHVLQGERSMAKDNKTLGKFQLSDIESASRGIPQIEVSFSIDVNGITSVKAKDKKTNKEHSIVIKSDRLSEQEIQKMVDESEANKEKDEKLKKDIDTKNQGQNLIYIIAGIKEKNLVDKILKDSELEDLTKYQAEIQDFIDKENFNDLELKLEEFNKLVYQIKTNLDIQEAQKKVEDTATSETDPQEVKDNAENVDDVIDVEPEQK